MGEIPLTPRGRQASLLLATGRIRGGATMKNKKYTEEYLRRRLTDCMNLVLMGVMTPGKYNNMVVYYEGKMNEK